MFTLEGILGDIVGSDTGMGFAIARRVAPPLAGESLRVPVAAGTRDWFTLQCSALLYNQPLVGAVEQAMLNRFLKPRAQLRAPRVNTGAVMNASAARKR